MKSIIFYIQSKTNLSNQEAWWMLAHVTKKTKEQLLFLNKSYLSEREKQILDQWITKLTKESMPLAYLLGFVPFINLSIKVKPPILIPRHETEEWVADVIKTLQPYKNQTLTLLDLGTGSGCIALALAKYLPHSQVTAVDINPQALELAQQNASLNNIKNISFTQSDLFKNIHGKSFDLIVSNPPYINPQCKKTMLPQVVKWEDEKALFAEDKGLQVIKTILSKAPQFLNKNKKLPFQLVLEFDSEQKDIIPNIASKLEWNHTIKKDSFGKHRTIFLLKKPYIIRPRK